MTLLGLALTLCALVTGALITLQAPINAEAAGYLGSPLAAASMSFAVGTLALLAVTALASRHSVDLAGFRAMPIYVLVAGGVMGAIYVTANLMLAPMIGVAALVALGITGQIAAALLLDSYGFFGLVERELSAGRLGGAAMVLAGALMVRYL